MKERRCFIHDRKLRAISVYNFLEEDKRSEYEELITEFCEIYKDKLPYHSCVLELGINEKEDFPFVIEFNSYGIDGFADATRYLRRLSLLR